MLINLVIKYPKKTQLYSFDCASPEDPGKEEQARRISGKSNCKETAMMHVYQLDFCNQIRTKQLVLTYDFLFGPRGCQYNK